VYNFVKTVLSKSLFFYPIKFMVLSSLVFNNYQDTNLVKSPSKEIKI
jgi:hypothetical protein